MHFDWDPIKAAANYKKHRVRFEEARLVFLDRFAIFEVDHVHPDRGILIGSPGGSRVLFVVYVDLSAESNDVYRIISARRASPTQRRRYEHGDSE